MRPALQRDFDFDIGTWQRLRVTEEFVFITHQKRNAYQHWYVVLRDIDGLQVEEELGEEQFADSDATPVPVAANSNVVVFPGRFTGTVH